MLKLFLCILGSVSIATAFTVDVTRTYFFNYPGAERNIYLQTDGLPPDGIDRTPKDITIKWRQYLVPPNSKNMLARVTFDYNGKYPAKSAIIVPTEEYQTNTTENLAINFFDRILAKDTRKAYNHISKGTHKCLGHLKWTRDYAACVHYDVPVIVTLEVVSTGIFMYRTSDSMNTKAIYEGEFKKDGQ